MSARETAELLLLVGRLVQADGYEGELSPAQWMALRFFARASSFSRTPSAFAEFQATTRGTASQAIKALEAVGYLVRQRSQADGRSVTLRLTDKGHEVVARDPLEALVRAVGLVSRWSKTQLTKIIKLPRATARATQKQPCVASGRSATSCTPSPSTMERSLPRVRTSPLSTPHRPLLLQNKSALFLELSLVDLALGETLL